MGSEIDVIQYCGDQGVALWGSNISLSEWNEIENIQVLFLHKQLGTKSSTSYCIMLFAVGA